MDFRSSDFLDPGILACAWTIGTAFARSEPEFEPSPPLSGENTLISFR